MRRAGRAAAAALASLVCVAAALRGEEPHAIEHGASADAVAFSIADFERHGVNLATAVAGVVDAGIELPAEVRADADRVAHLAPRFPGVVRGVHKQVGDTVRAGEVLARIESENLAEFSLTAAFAGTVLAKHIAPGEMVAASSTAFIIADLSTVWIDIHVHQRALDEVRVGQAVRVASRGEALAGDGVISYVTPVLDPTTRTATARVVLANPRGEWRPGAFVVATVEREIAADVVVPRRALHRHAGEDVVFVGAGGSFAMRRVTVGAVGRSRAEITAGLAGGERVADANSFLVKAELEKGAAEHEH